MRHAALELAGFHSLNKFSPLTGAHADGHIKKNFFHQENCTSLRASCSMSAGVGRLGRDMLSKTSAASQRGQELHCMDELSTRILRKMHSQKIHWTYGQALRPIPFGFRRAEMSSSRKSCQFTREGISRRLTTFSMPSLVCTTGFIQTRCTTHWYQCAAGVTAGIF